MILEPILTAAVADPLPAVEILAPAWMAHIWFILLCVLLTGYAVLDGFDLGVGIIHFLVGRTARERTVHTNVIGPIWDGNEVWLVTFGGGMFAAFPLAYGSIFSAFMVPLVIVLFCLIARATSLEFRSKATHWSMVLACDLLFSLASIGATFVLGVATGAVMEGIPIDSAGNLVLPASTPGGSPGPLAEITFAITPFTLACGGLAVLLFALHGAMFLNLKATGITERRIRSIFPWLFSLFLIALLAATYLAFQDVDAVTGLTLIGTVTTILNVLAIINLAWAMRNRGKWRCFLASTVMVTAMIVLFGSTIHPNLLVSSLDPAWNISIEHAASTQATLLTMFVVVVIGIPFVLLYTAITYWTFRGTVSVDDVPEQGSS